MAMEMRRPRELGRAEVAEMALGDGRLVASMRPHSGHRTCLGELDHLSVHDLERGGRLGSLGRSTRTRSLVGRHRGSLQEADVVSNNDGETWEMGKRARCGLLTFPESM